MKLDLSLKTLPSIRIDYRRFLGTECGAHVYQRFKRALYTDNDSLIQSLNNNVLQYLPNISAETLKVCDIGGGDGRRISQILEFLHGKFGLQFTMDFVEQSSYLMHSFDPKDISSFTKIRNFEILFEDAKLPCGYDLIFLIHSIFGFESSLAVDKILSLLAPSGTIIVVSNAQDSFLAGLKKILDVGYEDTRFEITDLLKILSDRGVNNRQTSIETKWAVRKEDLAHHIDLLLEWLSLGKRADIGEDRKREIHEYICGNTVDLGQRMLFSEREIIVVAALAKK